ncbi:hypothetical protein LINPERPRIM_LOCUS4589 [Linum perenne]
MAKLSFLHLFTFALIFMGMVFVQEVEGQSCTTILYPGGCVAQKCQKDCNRFHPGSQFICRDNKKYGESDECWCSWNC